LDASGEVSAETADAQRVDAPNAIRGRDLQQTQFWKKGAFAKKLGVDADRGLRPQYPRQLFELCLLVNPNRIRHCIRPRVQFDGDYD
jgi:hypothetical protein